MPWGLCFREAGQVVLRSQAVRGSPERNGRPAPWLGGLKAASVERLAQKPLALSPTCRSRSHLLSWGTLRHFLLGQRTGLGQFS